VVYGCAGRDANLRQSAGTSAALFQFRPLMLLGTMLDRRGRGGKRLEVGLEGSWYS